MKLGDEIKRLRLAAGLSQEQLAGRAGRHQTLIGQFEAGRKSPSLETLAALAEVFRAEGVPFPVDVEDILGLKPAIQKGPAA